ncbi:transposase [Stigmatella sp. ncwal1]|uniref:Transposase n=1 Tax=Stigmatella ashevillensis TaxID=2995309 RepID=A0ABT5DM10_9BACT|nr:transposase [Stigmatella ashevillena]MDC0713763.1 transposase [Stigmatella ashevillena]
MSFIPFFGSALQVTPHFHSLVPDGVFVQREGGVRFEALPPPTQGEVEQLLRVVRHRVLRLLEKRGANDRQGLDLLTRAMPLEQKKHVLALQGVHEMLEKTLVRAIQP